MRLALADEMGFVSKPRKKKQAGVRIVILVLVSFLLGVAATALWFHLAPNRNVENSSPQVSGQEGQPDNAPSEEPAVKVNPPARPFVASHPPVDATTIEEVKSIIPDVASVTLAEGEQMLREATLKKFEQAAKDMDAQVQQAQQQITQAQNSGSPDGQQAARKHLQQVQAQGTEKLQQIASQLQAQIAALTQLKNAK